MVDEDAEHNTFLPLKRPVPVRVRHRATDSERRWVVSLMVYFQGLGLVLSCIVRPYFAGRQLNPSVRHALDSARIVLADGRHSAIVTCGPSSGGEP